MRTMLTVGFALCLVGGAQAQSTDPLPGKLAGWWTTMTPRGVFKGTLSMAFDGSLQPGPITGRLTVNARSCGALDEPFSGTWDGTTLRFDATHRPNVNAQIKDGTCGSGHVSYVLRRKSGDKSFEGELHLDGAQVVTTASLSP
jgi:hypothetical protein